MRRTDIGQVARLHWLVRAVLAAAFGTLCGRMLLIPMEFVGRETARKLLGAGVIDAGAAYRVQEHVVFFLPGAVMSLVGYGLLTLITRRPAVSRPTCRSCGYDLTANASGICPECGHAIR